jgi:predicted transcriptional regulator
MVGEMAFGYFPLNENLKRTMRGSRRGRIDMIASILRNARDGVETTHLVHGSNLTLNQLQSYLELLLKNNLLGMTVDSSRGKNYKTTLKGMAFLGHYYILTEDFGYNMSPSEIRRMFSR